MQRTRGIALCTAVVALAGCGKTSAALGPPTFFDCSLSSGTITFTPPTGGTQTFSPDFCTFSEETDGAISLDFSSFNSGGWQFGNDVFIELHVDNPASIGAAQTATEATNAAALTSGQTAISFWDNQHPRTKYTANAGQSVTLTSALPTANATARSTATVAATGIQLSSGATLDFNVGLSLTPTSNLCQPYAGAVTQVINSNQCAGAPADATKIEQGCDDGERRYIEPANCSAAYATYLQCAIDANVCSPCVTEYCAFNACMCNYWDPGTDGCLASCP